MFMRASAGANDPRADVEPVEQPPFEPKDGEVWWGGQVWSPLFSALPLGPQRVLTLMPRLPPRHGRRRRLLSPGLRPGPRLGRLRGPDAPRRSLAGAA